MTLPRKSRHAQPQNSNALRRLMSLADWPFDEFPDQSEFARSWSPAVDLSESRKSYLVKADIPGVEPKDVEVTMENGVLTVRGERQDERREESDDVHRVERFTGRFARQFSLPDAAEDGIDAKMKDGVLEIRIPKSEKAQARKIEIKS